MMAIQVLKPYKVILLLLFNFTHLFSQNTGKSDTPPNVPAEVVVEKNKIMMLYENSSALELNITGDALYSINKFTDTTGDKITQVISINSYEKPLKVEAVLRGSEESFPCEAERKRKGLDIVRHSYGLSNSLLNRAVYDRKRDWLISIDYPAKIKIIPEQINNNENRFKIEITGYIVNIRFTPLFFNKHRNLGFYEPWKYKIWKEPVAGWCSWFAYFNEITEENVKYAADVISKELAPFGYKYLQIDDGYQQEPLGPPNNWLNPNKKFKSGLSDLAGYIKGTGLIPGIWTNVAFNDKEYVLANKKYFVTDEKENPVLGRWIGYSFDGSNPKAVESLVKPVYAGLKKMEWDYFKVDALRHLRYEGYNSNKSYFKNDIKKIEIAFRNVLSAIRKETGTSFILGCWGIRPELIGLIDGCRIGGDGFGLASLAQFNSFNNIVWRNDPDHIELSEKQAYRSCMVTSLTGSLFMLTDKPEKYLTDIVEPAKRSVPTLFTLPGQMYDVDPSRSMNIDHVSSQLSGDGERDFDASLSSSVNLFLLEINTTHENWVLLGRTGGEYESIDFNELGLSAEKEYLIFEFWSKTYLGSFSKTFFPGKMNPKYNCQLFCIRKRKDHPQVLASNRHITCGALEMEDVGWRNNILSGKSNIVGKDEYILYVFESGKYEIINFAVNGAKMIKNIKNGLIREIHILSENSNKVEWKIEYNGKK